MALKLKIILLTMCGAIAFGILHDEITGRICLEYFTIAHPKVLWIYSTRLLIVFWGIAGTVWIGLVFGVLLARASVNGDSPPASLSHAAGYVFSLLESMAAASLIGGLTGYELFTHSIISLPSCWSEAILPSSQAPFAGVWFAHITSYVIGICGAGYVVLRIWNQREQPQILSLFPDGKTQYLRTSAMLLLLALTAWWRLR